MNGNKEVSLKHSEKFLNVIKGYKVDSMDCEEVIPVTAPVGINSFYKLVSMVTK